MCFVPNVFTYFEIEFLQHSKNQSQVVRTNTQSQPHIIF